PGGGRAVLARSGTTLRARLDLQRSCGLLRRRAREPRPARGRRARVPRTRAREPVQGARVRARVASARRRGARRRRPDGGRRPRARLARAGLRRRGPVRAARARGGAARRGISDGVALAPPLVVEDEHVELAVAALAAALDGLG